METGIGFAALDPDAPERFIALRRQLGVTSFGMNQILLRPGERGRIHTHFQQEEVYLVLSGTLTLWVDGERHDLGQGEIARVAPDLRRQLANPHPEPVLILALGGSGEHVGRDGEAYETWDGPGAPPPQIPLPENEAV
jgi:mannose-6-phosphate isomerase-like protein (cupin superfamily)